MYKEHKLVMLPTNEKANLLLGLSKNGKLVYYDNTHTNPTNGKWCQKYHLYILSDETPKENDWFYYNGSFTKVILKAEKINLDTINVTNHSDIGTWVNIRYCKKILASTDKSLKQEIFGLGETAMCSLPQIPQQFIEYFVEQYNQGNVIDKAMVEYEELFNYEISYEVPFEIKLKTKKNNNINIKPIKEKLYSREDVVDLCKKAFQYGNSLKFDVDFDKWVKENLK